MRIIEGKLHDDLHRLAYLEAPREAVGLILSDNRIVSLTNTSESPETSFQVSRETILAILQHEGSLEEVVLWHTHPGGGIGPSRQDLQHKTPLNYHLVLSLIDDDIVPTWY